jgi:hypothetical protein
VRTQDVWWINQVTSGIKPIASENIRQASAISIDTTIDNNNLEELGSPAFGIIA